MLVADRHHALTEGVRALLETAFGTIVMVGDGASLLDAAVMEAGADAFVVKRAIATDLLPAVARVRGGPGGRAP